MNIAISFLLSNPFGVVISLFIVAVLAINLPFMIFFMWQGVSLVLGDYHYGGTEFDYPYMRGTKLPMEFNPLFLPTFVVVGFFNMFNYESIKEVAFLFFGVYLVYQILRQTFLFGNALGWDWARWVVFIITVVFGVVGFVVLVLVGSSEQD